MLQCLFFNVVIYLQISMEWYKIERSSINTLAMGIFFNVNKVFCCLIVFHLVLSKWGLNLSLKLSNGLTCFRVIHLNSKWEKGSGKVMLVAE